MAASPGETPNPARRPAASLMHSNAVSKCSAQSCTRLASVDSASLRSSSSTELAKPYQSASHADASGSTVSCASRSPAAGTSNFAAHSRSGGPSSTNAAASFRLVIGAAVAVWPTWRTIWVPTTRTCSSAPKNGVPKPPSVQRSAILPLTRRRAGESTYTPSRCSARRVSASVSGGRDEVAPRAEPALGGPLRLLRVVAEPPVPREVGGRRGTDHRHGAARRVGGVVGEPLVGDGRGRRLQDPGVEPPGEEPLCLAARVSGELGAGCGADGLAGRGGHLHAPVVLRVASSVTRNGSRRNVTVNHRRGGGVP